MTVFPCSSTAGRRIRIAQVTGASCCKFGGLERALVGLAAVAGKRGHCFHVITETPACAEFLKALSHVGGTAHWIPARGIQGPAFGLRFSRFLRGWSIDLVQAHFSPADLLALAAARAAGVVGVHLLHSGLGGTSLSLRQIAAIQLRRMLAQETLAVSEAIAREFSAVGVGRARVGTHYIGTSTTLGLPRSVARERLGLAPEALVVGCVAHHSAVKGLDVLLRAMSALVDEFPTLRLVQVGTGTDTPSLKQLAASLGLGPCVEWLGSRDDVPEVLPAFDVYCQPSRSEGLPLAIIEAMVASLPVVATSVGGVAEAVVADATGLLVQPERPDQLTRALRCLLADPARRAELGRGGRALVVERFRLETQAEALIDRYEQLVAAFHGTQEPTDGVR